MNRKVTNTELIRLRNDNPDLLLNLSREQVIDPELFEEMLTTRKLTEQLEEEKKVVVWLAECLFDYFGTTDERKGFYKNIEELIEAARKEVWEGTE